MSLARTALRLATVEALSPFALAATGPWPTIAGPLVYDSRVDLLQEGADLDAIEGKPILIVYTEEDHANPYGTAKYPPDEQVVHLVVEAMIAAKGIVTVDIGDGQTQVLGLLTAAAITTAKQEMLVDLLEAQVRRVVDTRNRAASAAILDRVAMEIHAIGSVPQRAEDRVTRMGARTITFHVKVRKTVWPVIPADALPTGLAALPEPLRGVAAALPPDAPGLADCLDLALFMAQPAALLPLSQIGVVSSLGATAPPLASVVLTDPTATPAAPQDPTLPSSP